MKKIGKKGTCKLRRYSNQYERDPKYHSLVNSLVSLLVQYPEELHEKAFDFSQYIANNKNYILKECKHEKDQCGNKKETKGLHSKRMDTFRNKGKRSQVGNNIALMVYRKIIQDISRIENNANLNNDDKMLLGSIKYCCQRAIKPDSEKEQGKELSEDDIY